MLHWYTLVCKYKLSWDSWVSLLDSGILSVDLLSKAPPTCCYHGDSPSLVSCWQRGEEVFSVLNPVKVHGHNNVFPYQCILKQ